MEFKLNFHQFHLIQFPVSSIMMIKNFIQYTHSHSHNQQYHQLIIVRCAQHSYKNNADDLYLKSALCRVVNHKRNMEKMALVLNAAVKKGRSHLNRWLIGFNISWFDKYLLLSYRTLKIAIINILQIGDLNKVFHVPIDSDKQIMCKLFANKKMFPFLSFSVRADVFIVPFCALNSIFFADSGRLYGAVR